MYFASPEPVRLAIADASIEGVRVFVDHLTCWVRYEDNTGLCIWGIDTSFIPVYRVYVMLSGTATNSDSFDVWCRNIQQRSDNYPDHRLYHNLEGFSDNLANIVRQHLPS